MLKLIRRVLCRRHVRRPLDLKIRSPAARHCYRVRNVRRLAAHIRIHARGGLCVHQVGEQCCWSCCSVCSDVQWCASADFLVRLRWESAQHTTLTIWLAVLAVYALDFAINGVQATDRALIVDLLPVSQQEEANAWVARL